MLIHSRQSAIALTVLGLLFFWPLPFAPKAGAKPYAKARAHVTRPEQRGKSADAQPAANDANASVRVRDGDTLSGVFARIGLSSADAQSALEALKKKIDTDGVQAGLEINVTRDASGVDSLRFSPDLHRTIVLRRSVKGGFTAFALPRALTHHAVRVAGRIESSLFDAALGSGLPPTVLKEVVGAFSYDVDFQRELQPGDRFEILYDQLIEADTGVLAGTGDIAYAALTLSGKTLALYRFTSKSGDTGFYDASGASIKKALLRTPVDGARISSGFGRRLHPILGYNRLHKGVDFAVPTGTPIFASGDAVVASAGRSGGYGNLVVLRHNSDYETAYGHMSRIAKGIRPGTHVRQGQVIGYVGQTGLATGPHLHYEVRVDDKAINPLSVRMETTQKLAGRELLAFQQEEEAVAHELATLRDGRVTQN